MELFVIVIQFVLFCCDIGHFGKGVPWRQPHCRSGLANLPSVGAVP